MPKQRHSGLNFPKLLAGLQHFRHSVCSSHWFPLQVCMLSAATNTVYRKNTARSERQTKPEWTPLLPRQGEEHLFLQHSIPLPHLSETPHCLCYTSLSQLHQWHRWHSQVTQSSFLLHSPIPSQIRQPCVLKEAEVIPKYSMCSCNQRAAACLSSTRQRHSSCLASPSWVTNSAALTQGIARKNKTF